MRKEYKERPILTNYVVVTSTHKKTKEWKRIVVNGVKTRYYINIKGDVMTETGTLIDPSMLNNYLRYKLIVDSSTISLSKHRLMACIFIPIPKILREMGYNQEHLEVNHIDGDKTNNDISNLEWATPSENTNHAVRTGLCDNYIGENCHLATITEKIAIKICELLESGMSVADVAKELNVNHKVVQHIRYGESWKNISKDFNFPKRGNATPYSYSDDDIHEVCKLLSTGKYTPTQISKMTGAERRYIGAIRDGKYRKDISSMYRFPKCENARSHKFSSDDIHKACKLLEENVSVREIIKETGLSESYIRGIKAGRTQTEISSQYNIKRN